MEHCGLVEVRGIEDAFGTPCGRSAETRCYDCCTSLCSRHAERCELCSRTFCLLCLSFHENEHPKPATRVRVTDSPKTKTA